MRRPGDDLEAALAVLEGRDGPVPFHEPLEVLHRSNNVVVRSGTTVVKVMWADDPAVHLEHELARHGVEVSAPVLAPLAPPSFVDGYALCWWPFVEVASDEADPAALADALKLFHDRMRSTTVAVGSVQETASTSLVLARDESATAAMPLWARAAIVHELEEVVGLPPWPDAPVVHGEPQSRNYLATDAGVVLIDLEGAKRAPIECDLAFLSPEVVERFWPDHDRELLSVLRRFVSAQVATACWRNVTARPGDDHSRWHAEHHSTRLLDEA